jgi:thymidylate synthase (FAD)
VDSLKVICPPSIGLEPGNYTWFDELIKEEQQLNPTQLRWLHLQSDSYTEYLRELEEGVKPEDARYVLTNASKTELACTYNLRQWRHVFKERALNTHAQWEIRSIFSEILAEFKQILSPVFEDLT